MKSRLLLLAALASTATGCKKEQPPAPSEPTARAAAPATPAAAPAATPTPVRKDPLAEVPRTDSTLSLLEPQGVKCQWLRADPVSQKRAVVATFDGDCKGARIAWSADLSKALVWFDPRWLQTSGYSSQDASPASYANEKPTPGTTPQLYEVTVASGETLILPFPSVEGELRTLGYKGAERLALSLKSLPEDQQGQPSVTVDGQVLTFGEMIEGLPAVAYAYQFGKDGAPKRVEVKASSEGSGMSLDISALDSASALGPRSTELLQSHLRNEGPELTEAQVSALMPFVPAPVAQKVKDSGLPEDMGWAHGVTPAGSFYVWQVMGDTVHTTGHLVFETGGQLQPVKELGFSDGDLVSVSAQGPFVLISAEGVGTHPRLYDLRTGKPAFRSDTARATTFWPSP